MIGRARGGKLDAHFNPLGATRATLDAGTGRDGIRTTHSMSP